MPCTAALTVKNGGVDGEGGVFGLVLTRKNRDTIGDAGPVLGVTSRIYTDCVIGSATRSATRLNVIGSSNMGELIPLLLERNFTLPLSVLGARLVSYSVQYSVDKPEVG
jgi:hypothetical protein